MGRRWECEGKAKQTLWVTRFVFIKKTVTSNPIVALEGLIWGVHTEIGAPNEKDNDRHIKALQNCFLY